MSALDSGFVFLGRRLVIEFIKNCGDLPNESVKYSLELCEVVEQFTTSFLERFNESDSKSEQQTHDLRPARVCVVSDPFQCPIVFYANVEGPQNEVPWFSV